MGGLLIVIISCAGGRTTILWGYGRARRGLEATRQEGRGRKGRGRLAVAGEAGRARTRV